MNNEDLLLVNQISSRIRDLIDSIACDPLPHREGCHCLRLQEHYGAFIFKCQKRHCPFFQQGFQHRADRYRHMKQHERLYKCEITTCDFSHLGFESVDDLQKHTAICHPSERILITQETIESCLDESEKHQTLHGAIEAGRADLVEVILNLISNPPWRELMKSAISGTSVEVLQVLKQAASSRAESSTQSPWIFEKPVWHAVNTASIEVLTYLVANNADINQIERVRNYSGTTIFATPLMKAACMGRIEAVRLFLASTPTIDATCALQELLCPKSGCPVYYEQFPSHIHPIDIVATTSALLDHGTIDIDQIPLTLLADGICNVEVGELLIDYGADVNVKVDGYTPLYLALRKNSGKRSACFAKMLLENGADPTVPCGPGNKRFCKGLAGARNIAKFVDVDFETVVSRTWGFNQNG